MSSICPSDIEVLLHCHVVPAPHPRENAPAVIAGMWKWIRIGAIMQYGDYYSTTSIGREIVKELCEHLERKIDAIEEQGGE